MSLSKKLRFDVFKRDDFQCQYCGRRSPDVILEVDHIISKKRGGEDKIQNLSTSCLECNRGKGAGSLKRGKISKDMTENIRLQKERENQLKEYYSYKRKIDKIKERAIDKIEKVLLDEEDRLSDIGRASIKRFLNMGFTVEDISEAWAISFNKLSYKDWESQYKYMCGILHNWGNPGRRD